MGIIAIRRQKSNDRIGCECMANHKFFQNAQCEYFPCHKTETTEDFNCLFCYCPLYALGAECGGNFVYTKNGVKDCSHCQIPHRRENYEMILERMQTFRHILGADAKGNAHCNGCQGIGNIVSTLHGKLHSKFRIAILGIKTDQAIAMDHILSLYGTIGVVRAEVCNLPL